MKINSIIDGRYKIISLVGKGGTAVVYKAININLGTEWAIKEISKKNKEKFDLLVEPNLLKKLQHPSLPRIVDILESNDTFYIIEDFIDGTALDNLLAQVDKFSEDKVIGWAKELSEVLYYLHNQEPNPIIYRDMKPGNIMLSKDGKIKLIDFGIAREYKKEVTSDTVIIGTRGYAAPEQYGKHQTDERSDIYSLGVTLYHLVTGKGPNDPPFEVVPIRSIDESLSEGLEHIILKCTFQDPNKRYQKVEELLYDLNNIDKLSNKYKKEQRNIKLKFAAIVATFIGFNLTILSGAYSIRNEQIGAYKYAIQIGVDTEKTIGLKDSVTQFETAIAMEPKRTEGYLALAEAYVKNMQFDDALLLLQTKAAAQNKKIKNLDEYHYIMGVCLFSKKAYKEASDEFKLVKKQDLYEGMDYYIPISDHLGKPSALRSNDEVIQSLDKLKQAIEKSTDEDFKIRGYLTLADVYRDNITVFKNGTDLAIETLEQAITQISSKNNIMLYDKLALVYYNKGIESADNEMIVAYNKALENYNMVIKLGYDSITAYRNSGNIYKAFKEFDKSRNMYDILIKKYPADYRGYSDMAELYYTIEEQKAEGSRNYTKMLEYYNLAKERNKDENNYNIVALEKKIELLKSKGLIN